MAVIPAENLIKLAQKGERLNSADRRYVISYLLLTKPEVGPSEMAELFQVSQRQIFKDRTLLKTQRASSLKEEDPALVLADIIMCFDRQTQDMEASKAKCKLGTPNYLKHCQTIFDTQLKKVTAMQSLGYYPKNLGNLVTESYTWKAEITADSVVNTRPVSMKFDKTNQKETAVEAEYIEVTDEDTHPPAELPPPE